MTTALAYPSELIITEQLGQPVWYGRNGLRRSVARAGNAYIVDQLGSKEQVIGKGLTEWHAVNNLLLLLRSTRKGCSIWSNGKYYRWERSRFVEVEHRIHAIAEVEAAPQDNAQDGRSVPSGRSPRTSAESRAF